MKTTTVAIGSQAERRAQAYLESHDFRLIKANFHSRSGEIDLIMIKDCTVVFVEVRYRNDTFRGTPVESITPHKVRRIIRTAEYFLLIYPQFGDMDFRFDVISITDKLQWIKNAFTLDR